MSISIFNGLNLKLDKNVYNQLELGNCRYLKVYYERVPVKTAILTLVEHDKPRKGNNIIS